MRLLARGKLPAALACSPAARGPCAGRLAGLPSGTRGLTVSLAPVRPRRRWISTTCRVGARTTPPRPLPGLPRRLLQRLAAPAPNLGGACEAGRAAAARPEVAPRLRRRPRLPPGDDAARAFFETIFPRPCGQSSDGRRRRIVHRLLRARAARRPRPAAPTAPLYRRPDDLITVDARPLPRRTQGPAPRRPARRATLRPSWNRAAIEKGALAASASSCSGSTTRSTLSSCRSRAPAASSSPDGGVVRVSSDGQNGQPYVPIGRVLVDHGAITIEQVTMQTHHAPGSPPIRPRRAGVMNRNPSYVFFRELNGDGRRARRRPRRDAHAGPLDRGRSDFIPLGAPVWHRHRRTRSTGSRCAADDRAGHRRRDQRPGARATSSGAGAPRRKTAPGG